MKQQTIESLEKQLNELKDRLKSAESNKSQSFERQVEQFEGQHTELNNKIDRLVQENLDKDKQIASLTHRFDRNADALSRKTSDYDQLREQIDKEKS